MGIPRGVVSNVLGCKIVVNDFELQSQYCIYFRTNTLGKCVNLLIRLNYWFKITDTFLQHEWLWHRITNDEGCATEPWKCNHNSKKYCLLVTLIHVEQLIKRIEDDKRSGSAHTHTHTHMYVYIYIYIYMQKSFEFLQSSSRKKTHSWIFLWWQRATIFYITKRLIQIYSVILKAVRPIKSERCAINLKNLDETELLLYESLSLSLSIYIYIYGEKQYIFGKSQKMMKNKWKRGYTETQTTDSVQNSSFFLLRELFKWEKWFFKSLAKRNR